MNPLTGGLYAFAKLTELVENRMSYPIGDRAPGWSALMSFELTGLTARVRIARIARRNQTFTRLAWRYKKES